MTEERSPYSGREITEYLDEKYTLYDVDGDKVGEIVEINEDFLVVERGGGLLSLGQKDSYFVPRSYIDREDGTDWYVNIDSDQLESMGWSERPTESVSEAEATDVGAPVSRGTRLVRYEEDVEAQKVARQAGDVTVGKHVVEDTKTIEVPVRREEVHVERHAVSGDASAASTDEAFTEDRITVPVMEEDVEVRKVARPVEEIEVTKTATEDTERVQDTVRREEFDVNDETGRTTSRDAG